MADEGLHRPIQLVQQFTYALGHTGQRHAIACGQTGKTVTRQIDGQHLGVFGQRQKHIPPCVRRGAGAVQQQDTRSLRAGLLHMPTHTGGLDKPAVRCIRPVAALAVPVHAQDGLRQTGVVDGAVCVCQTGLAGAGAADSVPPDCTC